MPDTIGRPGGWTGSLWILGNVYSEGVRGNDTVRNAFNSSEIVWLLTMVVNTCSIFFVMLGKGSLSRTL
ncbi:hypothetical protein XELAEV_18004426mg [Xenopus laevis]|uniref:Uncharacterized protein n=1 Tax=Xenopus laevis TaxID=8355 RepID=A0A974GYQ2_XENLA|nr:hypothetical protein XELAEV_18004426mg [Xenopus laevis]